MDYVRQMICLTLIIFSVPFSKLNVGALDRLAPFMSFWVLKVKLGELSFNKSDKLFPVKEAWGYIWTTQSQGFPWAYDNFRGSLVHKPSIPLVWLDYQQWELQVRNNSTNRKAWVPWAGKWYPKMPGYTLCVHCMWECFSVSLVCKLVSAVNVIGS